MTRVAGTAPWLLLLLLCVCCAPFCAAQQDTSPGNACDLKPPVAHTLYCYCDLLKPSAAHSADCWVFGDAGDNDSIWDTFSQQPRLQDVTVNLRDDGSLQRVPSRLPQLLTHLWRLRIKGADISSVHADALAGSASLGEVQLAASGIQQLARHAFRNLTNLTRLDLGSNKIETIKRHVFKNVPKLRLLNLSHNAISSLQNAAFAGLGKLKQLDLSENTLETITAGTFRGLRRLTTLSLCRNVLQTIEDETFSAMQSLKRLDLEENRLKYISSKALVGLESLEWLNLHNNKLLRIVPGTFRETLKVKHLDLRQNVLHTLEEDAFLPVLSNMKEDDMQLFLEGNNLGCDCRLDWLLRLRNSSRSLHLQTELDRVICHMASGQPPPRALPPGGSTLGIGPPVRLTDLQTDELPCNNTSPSPPPPPPRTVQRPGSKPQPGRRFRAQQATMQQSDSPVVGPRRSGQPSSQHRANQLTKPDTPPPAAKNRTAERSDPPVSTSQRAQLQPVELVVQRDDGAVPGKLTPPSASGSTEEGRTGGAGHGSDSGGCYVWLVIAVIWQSLLSRVDPVLGL